jgi:hypothetical protein
MVDPFKRPAPQDGMSSARSVDKIRKDDEFKDQRVEKRYDSKLTHMQFPFLNGPFAIPWQIHEGYSESAKLLLPRHREAAFLASYARSNYCYCRYLGLHVEKAFRNEYKTIWHLVLKKTKRNLIAGDDRQNTVRFFAQFLTYLGDLHVQIVRCLENGVNLRGTVKDLRAADLQLLEAWLDKENVPSTNEQNPYRALQVPAIQVGAIQKIWLQQQDKQIDNLHVQLDCGV